MDDNHGKTGLAFPLTLFLMQAFILIIWVLYGSYAPDADGTASDKHPSNYTPTTLYQSWLGVHAMMLFGFGNLMTFLHRHGYSASGYTFLMTCLGLQWCIILYSFMHGLIGGGGLRGPTLDVTMLFQGAYFGLVCSYILHPPSMVLDGDDRENRASYTSDMFAMIGTLFLFLYWPSFNGGLLDSATNQQERALVNTVLSLAGSCLATFLFSKCLRGHFSMVDVQNATLAGGVAVGSTCNMNLGPGGALSVGLVSGREGGREGGREEGSDIDMSGSRGEIKSTNGGEGPEEVKM
ncbi:ammonium transporter 1 [Nannochloropsis oceanica]